MCGCFTLDMLSSLAVVTVCGCDMTVVRRVTLRECALLPGHSLSDCVGCTLDMFLSLSVMVIVIVVIV